MKAGIALTMDLGRGLSDVDAVRNHLALGDHVEALGFDSLFALEHHFTDYVLSPSPLMILSYFAGRTTTLMLGTAVIVLPWHDPILVAEQILVLEAVSGGRGFYGLGRGRSEIEFAGLGVDRADSAERWREGLHIIRAALSGEVVMASKEGPSLAVQVRPRPAMRSLDRLFAPASDPDGARRVREAGLGLFLSTSQPWKDLAETAEAYRSAATVPSPVVFAAVSVAPSRMEAEERAFEFLAADSSAAAMHYALPDRSPEPVSCEEISAYVSQQIIGTPSDCVEQLHELRRLTGTEHVVFEVSYGGLPRLSAEANLRLLAAELLPVMRRW